jgi:ABC-type antimicrobial peptide transport system, permease component
MRIDRDSINEILLTLTRNKSRSFLTGFGVFWGVLMLLVLLGGSKGLKGLLNENFEGFATNSVFMVAQPTTKPYKGFKKGRNWTLNTTDIKRLKESFPELETVTAAQSAPLNTVTYGNQKIEFANYNGVAPDYVKIEAPILKYGRFINEMDLVQGRKVCVIGKRVYETLFPQGGDPCGKYLKADNVYFEIVGVDVRTGGSININGRSTDKINVPYTVLNRLFNSGENVAGICATIHKGYKVKDIESDIRKNIAHNHGIAPDDRKGVFILNMEELFGIMDSIFKGIDILMMLVGLGTILAGAIGVSNIMMVTVKERTTEIGIRRAIGATPSMILSQIIVESIVLTLVSGLAGIVLSVFILNAADMVMTSMGKAISFQIGIRQASLSLLFLMVLGVLAGLAPASRAMKIRPVDAMREE